MIIWIKAGNIQQLISGYAEIVPHIGLRNLEGDETIVARRVKHWFETQRDFLCLVILDNADTIDVVPGDLGGITHILVTTRDEAAFCKAGIPILTMNDLEAIEFLFRCIRPLYQ